jgi:hypothetical protein
MRGSPSAPKNAASLGNIWWLRESPVLLLFCGRDRESDMSETLTLITGGNGMMGRGEPGFDRRDRGTAATGIQGGNHA